MANKPMQTVPSDYGFTFRLGNFGMKATKGATSRYVARSEMTRIFRELQRTNSVSFTGSETHNNGKDFDPCVNYWHAHLTSTGTLELGCMSFSKAATNKLRKWARV